MKGFIDITSKVVSNTTGEPKMLRVNVNHIVSVEKVLWEIPVDMDHVELMNGTTIILSAGAHTFEIDSRDPYEHVLARMEKAVINDAATVFNLTVPND